MEPKTEMLTKNCNEVILFFSGVDCLLTQGFYEKQLEKLSMGNYSELYQSCP